MLLLLLTLLSTVHVIITALPDGETPPSTRRSIPNTLHHHNDNDQFCSSNGIYFKQLLAGEDFAIKNKAKTSFDKQSFRFAAQMQNYVYLIGDRESGECVVVDGCWDPKGINKIARQDQMNIIGFVATHYHWDHVGGKVDYEPFKSLGVDLPGLKDFVLGSSRNQNKNKVKNKVKGVAIAKRQAWISQVELSKAAKRTGVAEKHFTPLLDGSVVDIGRRLRITFRHTPGHSPGSMVLLVSDRKEDKSGDDTPLFMISGDTLFPGSCGRVDLPESNAANMYDSLQIVGSYPEELVIFPGHSYSGANTTIRKEKLTGLLKLTRKEWMRGR
jgi:glyoxylase-like metal-dependent hydrolase (beta-lactamase superfamily II)